MGHRTGRKLSETSGYSRLTVHFAYERRLFFLFAACARETSCSSCCCARARPASSEAHAEEVEELLEEELAGAGRTPFEAWRRGRAEVVSGGAGSVTLVVPRRLSFEVRVGFRDFFFFFFAGKFDVCLRDADLRREAFGAFRLRGLETINASSSLSSSSSRTSSCASSTY